MARIDKCRSCESSDLVEVVTLGNLAFTGIFPLDTDEMVPYGPLDLLHCQLCGLGQLADSFPAEILYGSNYGYRSGLNASMVTHLNQTVQNLENIVQLQNSDSVLDIGANDGTLLNAFRNKRVSRFGIDPTITKFHEYYEKDIVQIPDFFSKASVDSFSRTKFKLITSIAMFYDLESPTLFASEIKDLLDENGYWYFEQSYAPWMIRTGAFDTICHEHLEYYSLSSIKHILDRVGLQIVEANLNNVNGGSISILATPNQSIKRNWSVDWLLKEESNSGTNQIENWKKLGKTIDQRRSSLESLLEFASKSNVPLYGLGASTKGNVLLQTLNLGPSDIVAIGEVNSYKWGRITPGSNIPIISENEVLDVSEKDLLILPWHFKDTFIGKFKNSGKSNRLIFPLPEVEVISL
jgi:hypothetical protein